MSYRLREQDAEYRNSMSMSLLVAVGLHLVLALVGAYVVGATRVVPEEPPNLGYEGPTRSLEELEVFEPNSVQSYFYQKFRRGLMMSPEYEVVEPVILEPGPDPVPVRQIVKRKEPEPDLNVFEADLELIEPLKPFHKEISFSQDFVILREVKPDYPEYEKTRSIEGQVMVKFFVTDDAQIRDEHITQSVTQPAGASPRAFELAALEAIRQWQVAPPRRNGKPQGGWMQIRIKFNLRTEMTP